MAQKVSVVLLSDVSGEEAAHTITFGLDGTTYEIDLTETEAADFREALAPYVGVARKTGAPARKGATKKKDGPDAKAVRAWARENGVEVSERGRVAPEVVEKYLASQG